jgi:hypothetical protein
MNETRTVKDLAIGDIIQVDGFDDNMTVRGAKKVKKGLDAGKLHVTLAASDGETEVIALAPEERVKLVGKAPQAGKGAPKAGKGAGKTKGKGKGKGKAKTAPADSAPTPESEIVAPAEAETAKAPETPAPEAAAAEPEPATPKKASRQKKAAGDKKLSAIDAAAKVLTETGAAMNCQELIKVMAEKALWTSPGGKTPHATLYTVVTMLPKAA